MRRLCLLLPLLFWGPAVQAADVTTGGYVLAYGMAVEQDETTGSLREFDVRKRFRVGLDARQILTNGTTVGMTVDLYLDRAQGGDGIIDQSYLYGENEWGRLQFGELDGAPTQLQVEAPSADPFIDGQDAKINAFDLSEMGGGAIPDDLDYEHQPSGKALKLVYLTPSWEGLQAGISYAPSVDDGNPASADASLSDDDVGAFANAWEAGILYKKEWDRFEMALGAGHSRLAIEEDDPDPASGGSANRRVSSAGAALTHGRWALGAAVLQDDQGIQADGDTAIRVLGVSYDLSEQTRLGASRYDRKDGADFTDAGDSRIRRHSLGLRHEAGSGLIYNGSIHHIDLENDLGQGQGTEIALGVQAHF